MDLTLVAKVLERAVTSLELDAPIHAWWLGEERPKRPVFLEHVLATPCPEPYELDPERVLHAFLPEDREAIATQIDDGYTHLVLRAEEPQAPPPQGEASVVYVRLGLPLIGRDRVLLRICTRNLYGDAATVTCDYHAWLDREGALRQNLAGSAASNWEDTWPRWVVGRSPGLAAISPRGSDSPRRLSS